MKKVYIFNAILFAPSVLFAHDDELHTAWYQEPMMAVSILIAVLAVAALSFGFITKRKNFIVLPITALVAVVVTSLISFGPNADTYEAQLAVADFGAGQSVTLYKSPNCGCCTGHAKALEEAGFTVMIEETTDLDAIKQSNNIPADGASCHTAVIGDYVI